MKIDWKLIDDKHKEWIPFLKLWCSDCYEKSTEVDIKGNKIDYKKQCEDTFQMLTWADNNNSKYIVHWISDYNLYFWKSIWEEMKDEKCGDNEPFRKKYPHYLILLKQVMFVLHLN